MKDLNLTLEQSLSFSDGRMFRSSCPDLSKWSNREISAYRLLWQAVHEETAMFILTLSWPTYLFASIFAAWHKQTFYITRQFIIRPRWDLVLTHWRMMFAVKLSNFCRKWQIRCSRNFAIAAIQHLPIWSIKKSTFHLKWTPWNAYKSQACVCVCVCVSACCDERPGNCRQWFFSQTRGPRSIDCARDNISRSDIWSCFMANTFLPADPRRVDRFPGALEARLNQRGTRYHPPRDWW